MTSVYISHRWRRRAVVLIIAGIGLLAIRGAADFWLGRRLDAQIARLETAYGPLRWDPVRRLDAWKSWPTRVGPENRARLMTAAAARVVVSEANQNLLNLPHEAATMTADQVREIADGNRDAVQLAILGSRLPHSNWGVRYVGELYNVPDLEDLQRLSRVLAVAARHDADAGRADEAAADVAAGFAEVVAMRSEPAVVMLLNAAALARSQASALARVLDRAEPSSTALAALARVIEEGRVPHPVRDALLAELKHGRVHWPWVEQGWLWGRRRVDYAAPATPSAWMRAVAWTFRPLIRAMALSDLAAKARAVDAASLTAADREKVQPTLPARTRNLLGVGAAWSAELDRAAVGVALRRYRLEHGSYPGSIEALAPSYLAVVPRGTATEYRRSGSGFTLGDTTTASGAASTGWAIGR